MQIDELAALLKRYHENRCTDEERRIVEEWYETLAAGESDPVDKDVETSMDKVWARLQENTAAPGQACHPDQLPPVTASRPRLVRLAQVPLALVPVALVRRVQLRRVLEVAAVVLLLAGIYTLAKRTGTAPTKAGADDTVELATVAGEVRQLALPDGSSITLNANTRLTYPKSFRNRQVRLVTGEAFFDIARDPKRPFIVETGHTRTQVLGTSFNIRSYERDTATVIALITGQVSVDGKSTLTPGDILTIGKTGSRQMGHFDNAGDVTAWENKAMYFQDASFEDIAFEMANTYNVTLVNASSKKHWSYTGYFEHESIWEIIRTICITEHLDFRSDQGHIILINKN
jgi:ferric-dicitrate binding protein FerR (iron transport regulator)